MLVNLYYFALAYTFLLEVIIITIIEALIMRFTKTIIYTVVALFVFGYFMVELNQIPYWLVVEDIFIFIGLYAYKQVKLKV